MWWCDRRGLIRGVLSALALALAALSGCGFTPAYGPGGAAGALTGRVLVQVPDDRHAFDLNARLEERLGRPAQAAYALDYRISTNSVDIGVSPTNAITRFNLLGRVEFTLRDLQTDAVLTTGDVRNFTAYSATGTTLATRTAELDARRRLMRILADQIVNQLVATSGTWAP
jgi:LPS-assembly lipoprotein